MLTCTQFKIYVEAKDSVQNGIIFWERVCLRWKRQQLAFVHDIFISLKSEVGVHKTSFIQAFFIEVIVARKSEQICIFVLCVSILRLAAIYRLIVYYNSALFFAVLLFILKIASDFDVQVWIMTLVSSSFFCEIIYTMAWRPSLRFYKEKLKIPKT